MAVRSIQIDSYRFRYTLLESKISRHYATAVASVSADNENAMLVGRKANSCRRKCLARSRGLPKNAWCLFLASECQLVHAVETWIQFGATYFVNFRVWSAQFDKHSKVPLIRDTEVHCFWYRRILYY